MIVATCLSCSISANASNESTTSASPSAKTNHGVIDGSPASANASSMIRIALGPIP
jgi:hypothetical protein